MSEQEWLEEFSEKLQELMEEANMTQRDLAFESGLGESTISNYIHRQRMPGVRAVINICEVLQCDFDELLWFGDTID